MVNQRVRQGTGCTAIKYKKGHAGDILDMRLNRVCAIVLVLALNPPSSALSGPNGTPVATGDSEEQEQGQTQDNEEPGCD